MTPNVKTAYCIGSPQDNLPALFLHIVVLDHGPRCISVRPVIARAAAIALRGRLIAGVCVAARGQWTFGHRHPCLNGYAGVAKLSVPDCSLVIAWVRHSHWWDLVRRIVVLLWWWCPVVHQRPWSVIGGLILGVATIGVVYHLEVFLVSTSI